MAQCGKVECMANAVPQDSEDEEAQGFREEEEARRGSRCLRCYALKIVFAAFILTILCGRKGKGLHGSVLEIFEGTGDRDPPSLPGLLQAGRQGGAEGPAETAEPTSTHTPEDREQWQNWIQEIRETIKKQKTRRDEQAQKLQEELAALEKKEEELGMGKSDNDQNPIQVEDLDAHKGERPGEVRQGEGRGVQQEACGHEGEDGGGIPTEIRDGLQRGQSTHAAPLSYPAGEGDECGATSWRPKHASSGSLARGLLFF